MHPSGLDGAAAATETALLGVLLNADSARAGAAELLAVLAPILDDGSAALAVRDRDGMSLHVLAENGPHVVWPERLEPQFAVGAQPGVDSTTGVLVIPMRASGRVVGALLVADARHGAICMRDDRFSEHVDTMAAVLHALLARTDSELRIRAQALRSVDAVVEGMAHQMANPLTGASAIAQLLIEDLVDEGHRAAVRQIRQELSRAFAVLHDVLEIQRDTRAQDGVLELTAFVERILRFRGYPIREQGIALEFEPSPAYLGVRADARGLEHALQVALRFAEVCSRGTVNRHIDVRTRALGESEVAVEITDSGPGDIPDMRPAYFDLPLARSEFSPRDVPAETPDLGLVNSLLRGAGGRLDIRGSKAAGTSLALILPRAATTSLPSQSRVPA